MKTKPYDELVIVPSIIASEVAAETYTGQEVSVQLRSGRTVDAVEKRRKQLTDAEVREFAELCDKRCRAAYEAGAPWFRKIARSKTNAGRDQLYQWVRHWFSAYCLYPDKFRHALREDGVTAAISKPTMAEQFQQTFGVNLKKFMHSVTGFDICKFNDDIAKPPKRKTLAQAIEAKHGAEAVTLIEALIQLRDPLDAWRNT